LPDSGVAEVLASVVRRVLEEAQEKDNTGLRWRYHRQSHYKKDHEHDGEWSNWHLRARQRAKDREFEQAWKAAHKKDGQHYNLPHHRDSHMYYDW